MSDAKPRRRDEWICGYATALADMNRLFDHPGFVRDVMLGGGITIAHMKRAGVDEYDLMEIKRCVGKRGRRG